MLDRNGVCARGQIAEDISAACAGLYLERKLFQSHRNAGERDRLKRGFVIDQHASRDRTQRLDRELRAGGLARVHRNHLRRELLQRIARRIRVRQRRYRISAWSESGKSKLAVQSGLATAGDFLALQFHGNSANAGACIIQKKAEDLSLGKVNAKVRGGIHIHGGGRVRGEKERLVAL